MKQISQEQIPVGVLVLPVVVADERLQIKPALFRREHVREALKIRVCLQIQNTEVLGYTQDISPSGLRLITAVALKVGTPLALQCSFSETCYLNLSGQVIWSYRVEDETSNLHSIGIKFAAVRELGAKILGPVIQDLKENRSTRETSLLTVRVSEDSLALEAAAISKADASTPVAVPCAVSAGHYPEVKATSQEKPKTTRSKRGPKFTSSPAWVSEMNQHLEPYRQAIWESKLVRGTSTGELSLKQVRGWSIQFYPFIEHFPQFMATYLAKATDPMSRSFLIDNLRVEKRHADQWIDMAVGFGVSKEELFTTPIIPEVEALTHWLWSITNRGSFVEGVAATNYSIEGVTQGIATIAVKGFITYHDKDGVFLNKKAYYWMSAHSEYDDVHPLEALEIMKLHATTPEMQQRITHAAQRSLEYLLRALDACYWAYAPKDKEAENLKLSVV